MMNNLMLSTSAADSAEPLDRKRGPFGPEGNDGATAGWSPEATAT
jgi:hypothetical protein